jgi:hypothetical protein
MTLYEISTLKKVTDSHSAVKHFSKAFQPTLIPFSNILLATEEYLLGSHSFAEVRNGEILLVHMPGGHISSEIILNNTIIADVFYRYYYNLMCNFGPYSFFNGVSIGIDLSGFQTVEIEDLGLYLGGSGNYGHVIKDCIPNALQIDHERCSVIRFKGTNYDDIFSTFLSRSRIQYLEFPHSTRIKFGKAIIPTRSPHSNLFEIYSGHTLSKPSNSSIIFLNKTVGLQRLANKDQIIEVMRSFGVEILNTVETPIKDLLTKLHSAKAIIACSDASAVNLLFGNQRTRSYLLINKHWFTSDLPDLQYGLDFLVSVQNLTLIFGEQIVNGNPAFSPFAVDPKAIIKLIRSICQSI